MNSKTSLDVKDCMITIQNAMDFVFFVRFLAGSAISQLFRGLGFPGFCPVPVGAHFRDTSRPNFQCPISDVHFYI